MFENLHRFNAKSTYLYFDMETENLCLNFIKNRPWQIATLKVINNEIVGTSDFYAEWDPPIFVRPEVAFINHFNQFNFNKIKKMQGEVFPEFYKQINEAEFILGANIYGFDIYLLKEWCKLHGKPWKHLLPRFIDTNCIEKAVQLGIKYDSKENFSEFQYKLFHKRQKGLKSNQAAAAKRYGIEVDITKLHSADYDLLVNKMIFDKQKYLLDI